MAYINASGQMDNQLGLLTRIQEVKVIIPTAQVLTMFTTPVKILPAPGANLVIVPVGPLSIQVRPGSTQFTGGGTVNLVYHGGSVLPFPGTVAAATVNSATASNNLLPGGASTEGIQPPTNTGIDITNATAVFATGNGSLVVKMMFRIQVVD